MIDVNSQIKTGIQLQKLFQEIDSEIKEYGYLGANTNAIAEGQNINVLNDRIKHFKLRSEKYFDSLSDLINTQLILLNNQNHEWVNDEEVDNFWLRDFYTCGLTIDQVLQELDALQKGVKIKNGDRDCAFIYSPNTTTIYENTIGSNKKLKVTSRRKKSETLCKVVFKQRYKFIPSVTIEDQRIKDLKKEHRYVEPDEEIKKPYQWTKDACDALNEHVKDKFGINYKLFETDPDTKSIRLSPMSKLNN